MPNRTVKAVAADNRADPANRHSRVLSAVLALSLLTACMQPYTVSINNQAVYDPSGRLLDMDSVDADLQGCINLALQQQHLSQPENLTALSCANSAIRRLENIGQLTGLRFLDLSDNDIANITPLEELRGLSGISLSNNRITDVSPLFNLPALVSVNLRGNDGIPCAQLRQLGNRLPGNLHAPQRCRN